MGVDVSMKKKSLSTLGFLGFLLVSGYGLYHILSRLDIDLDIFGENIYDDEEEFHYE